MIRVATTVIAAAITVLAAPALAQPSEADVIAARRQIRPQCALPAAPADHDLLVAGATEPETAATVIFDGARGEAQLVAVEVERGDTPITFVIAPQHDTIWDMRGAVERLRRVVVLGNEHVRRVGVMGVPNERVSFADVTPCHSIEWSGFIRDASENPKIWPTAFGLFLGRRPDKVLALNDVTTLYIPSGRIERSGPTEGQGALIEQRGAAGLEKFRVAFGADGRARVVGRYAGPRMSQEEDEIQELMMTYPGGIIKVDPARVVSRVPVRQSSRFDRILK